MSHYNDQILLSLKETGSANTEPLRCSKSILELSEENTLDLVTRALFVKGGVRYPPGGEVFMSLQVPAGDRETNRHVRALASCAHDKPRRREAELDASTACALARIAASRGIPADIPYSPNYSGIEDSMRVESHDDELFGSGA